MYEHVEINRVPGPSLMSSPNVLRHQQLPQSHFFIVETRTRDAQRDVYVYYCYYYYIIVVVVSVNAESYLNFPNARDGPRGPSPDAMI